MAETDPLFDAYERMVALQHMVQIPVYPGDAGAGRNSTTRSAAVVTAPRDGARRRTNPQLAGQYSPYLLRQIDKFRNGVRIHDPEEPEATS